MIKPIPKKLLPNSVIYKKYLGNTGEGDEWGNDVPLNHVRIEEKTQFRVSSNGREIVGNARMFYDYINSTGLTKKPSENDIIVFNGYEYHVVETNVLRADSSIPHHYEVILK